VRVDESIRLDVPRDDVWLIVSDPSGYPQFMDGVNFGSIDGEPPVGYRARYTLRMEVRSAEVGGVVEVTEWEPPHELAWTSITGIQQRGRWVLRECGPGQTDVTLRFSYQAPGGVLALVADRLSMPMVRGNLRRSLAGLKRLLEDS
jgi:uncharacterized membrane protein